ncbi:MULTISPECIES: FtsX-like permease family protein [unclassified Lactobacillus]|uniref:FtsX-like permease family protein n=1 Tax=unclassified Lactobacillus TaxID=2620435 RepID=UPI0018DB860F|nr:MULTISPECIES: FtsX-like permease family protein [unclassified Lactobacillus]MBH9988892.1 ABC transporter permease [Lactobacillus sp. M0392]MBI0023489.1 ABC transporter permease [Lactobacillus sp. W8171]MBI0043894.1 ABC transporter permease [Lactobacillus sp. M0393]
MIWKLSVTGIKNRLKDYLVLFSGLIVASMIFYMFLSIATNPVFISKDVYGREAYLNYIFTFGIILLVIITSVYLVYANSFLLSMRKHDYGMYMMLGAKSTRIGLLIFSETLLTGFLAVLLGITLGLGLTTIVTKVLVGKLGLEITHYKAILPSAIIGTLLFFVIIFLLGALGNMRKLTRTPIIDLLHEDQTPINLNHHPVLRGIEAICGVLLLAVGYYVMTLPANYIYLLIPTALVTIIVGSFFVFNGVFTAIINYLLNKKSFSYRGINEFTLGQLKFRLQSYTKVLTMISILFALALGAITVGLNFGSMKDEAQKGIYYDATIVSQTPAVKKAEAKLTITNKQTYHYKEKGMHLYFNRAEFEKQPLKEMAVYFHDNQDNSPTYKVKTLATAKLDKPQTTENSIFSQMVPNGLPKKIHLVSPKRWLSIDGQEKFVSYINVKDFVHDFPVINQIQKQQLRENRDYKDTYLNSKPYYYSNVLGFTSAFEFMGFFLGIAFLTMLASTLMFKVLSGAASDKVRYQMLHEIGARPRLLRSSIRKEIGTLFTMPGILGIIDVLCGLQLFKTLLKAPYHNIWIPFTIFIVLYLGYYLLTVTLYEKIVLKTE